MSAILYIIITSIKAITFVINEFLDPENVIADTKIVILCLPQAEIL